MLPAKVAANEEIRRAQIEIGVEADQPLPFLCECLDVGCRALVRLLPSTYAEVRAEENCIVLGGHPFVGRVVREGDGYMIVEE